MPLLAVIARGVSPVAIRTLHDDTPPQGSGFPRSTPPTFRGDLIFGGAAVGAAGEEKVKSLRQGLRQRIT